MHRVVLYIHCVYIYIIHIIYCYLIHWPGIYIYIARQATSCADFVDWFGALLQDILFGHCLHRLHL